MKDQSFISRKADHIRVALLPESEARGLHAFDEVTLIHDSLPDLNLSDVDISSTAFGSPIATPFFVAGMTAGHSDAELINQRLAQCAARRGWVFGVGSQRRELDTSYEDSSLQSLKKMNPELKLVSNLGIAQLIELNDSNQWEKLIRLLENSQADALAIHLNPIQEAVQLEGTPNFKGAYLALEVLCEKINLPIVLKETGSGMSSEFLSRVSRLKIAGVDVSGLGGTHWGRVEGLRAPENSKAARLGETFKHWGVSTVDSILNAKSAFDGTPKQIWASGGVRTGLDAAKCVAIGASRVGFAKPALEAALKGEAEILNWMDTIETELRIALFCTNSKNISELNDQRKWIRS